RRLQLFPEKFRASLRRLLQVPGTRRARRPALQEKELIPAARVLAWSIKLEIRQARLPDLAVLADFNVRMARETEQRNLDPERVRNGVRALLEDPTKGVYFVAETDGAVAGQLLLTYEWSDWRNGIFWWIQ